MKFKIEIGMHLQVATERGKVTGEVTGIAPNGNVVLESTRFKNGWLEVTAANLENAVRVPRYKVIGETTRTLREGMIISFMEGHTAQEWIEFAINRLGLEPERAYQIAATRFNRFQGKQYVQVAQYDSLKAANSLMVALSRNGYTDLRIKDHPIKSLKKTIYRIYVPRYRDENIEEHETLCHELTLNE